MKLKLDIKTRWNSILAMARRLIRVQPAIEPALNYLKEKRELFGSTIFDSMKELIKILGPLEEAILSIGRSNTNLLEAEAAIKFVISKINKCQSTMARNFLTTLKDEIVNRRNKEIVSLFKFLQTKSFDFLNDTEDNRFGYNNKAQIIRTAERLYYHLFVHEYQRDELEQYLDTPSESGEQSERRSDSLQPDSLAYFLEKEMAGSSEESVRLNMNKRIQFDSGKQNSDI